MKVRKKQGTGKWLKIFLIICLFGLLGIAVWKEIAANGITRDIPVQKTWNLVVVNNWNEMPEEFDLTLMELSNGQKVDSRVYPYLQKMFDTARSEGVYPIVREGYRSEEAQQQILDERIQRYKTEGLSAGEAEKAAKQYVALPGMSEHHLGSAVDINADTAKSTNEEVYAWLAANAYKFGFILRYPEGKEEITGINYEPWHYRYVGKAAAKVIYENQMCLEEYFQ